MKTNVELNNIKENFIVLPYNFEQLKEIFIAFSKIDTNYLEHKLDNDFYKDYLETLGVKTIVIEKEYIDKDFLNDYANYYVKCFKLYERFCTRLHFFSCELTENSFNSILTNYGELNNNLCHLQENYLGYIVVKNLPQSIIGKTCLKCYPKDNCRNFPATVNHKVHLAGLPLNIKTLPFQEQDSVVAACATSSLWSMFYGTGELFHHSLPSPYEITKAATQDFPISNRAFPNSGLTLEMISKAISKVGLEPLSIRTNSPILTKSAIYAYLKAHLPVMLAVTLQKTITAEDIGGHAVTIVGYNLDNTKQIDTVYQYIPNSYPIKLRATNITKLYVHDDQVGPFARMEFGAKATLKNSDGTIKRNPTTNDVETTWALYTSFGIENKRRSFCAIPQAILIPTYHKIRIPFEAVLKQIYEFNHLFIGYSETRNNEKLKNLANNLSWEIFLTDINEFKYSILCDSNLSDDERLRISKQRYPRFLWRVKVYSSDNNILDFVFDATDIEQNEYIIDTVVYSNQAFEMLKAFACMYYENGLYYTENKIINNLSAQYKISSNPLLIT